MSTITRSTHKIDYTGQTFGPFTAIEPAGRKRYWKLRCPSGHITERRIDVVKRTLPALLHCQECEKPAPKPTRAALTSEQSEALRILDRSLALTIKALQTVTAVLRPAPAA